MSSREQPELVDDGSSRHTFDPALRGYDKRQVDQFVADVEHQIGGLSAERDNAHAEIRRLGGMTQSLQAELAELRERPVQIDRASFRDLGPMVDQMLALAEKQAGTIIGAANQRASSREAESERLLNEVRDRAAKMSSDLDAQLARRRADADQGFEARRASAEAEITKLHEQAERARAEAEGMREGAEQESRQVKEQNAQYVERARAEADALITAARTQGEQELAQQRAELTQEINGRRTEAAQRIAALHAQAQAQADELRRRMDEQTAGHQQQLKVLQEEIGGQRQTLSGLQSEVEAADQRLAAGGQQKAAIDGEIARLQHRLKEVGDALAAEHQRLEEAKRAGEAAVQHARDVRARVRQEAKRVAEMAAAAVMAAAADVSDTGEFPKVVVGPGGERAARPQRGEPRPAPGRGPATGVRPLTAGNGVPAPRGPQPATLAE